ncbi:MAG: DUF192 domain-containing protein [bacterium]
MEFFKKKKIWLVFLVLVISSVVFFVLARKQTDANKVCFKGRCFEVEIAASLRQRNDGLMFRQSLGKNKGMLFVFSESGDYSFWMKNTFIPLDIVWIDERQKVVFIKENAESCLEETCPAISPGKKALYVLEINAGIVADSGLEIGDNVVIDRIDQQLLLE